MSVDLDRLQADADACLAFLIERQAEWAPELVALRYGSDYTIPVTLIAVERASLTSPREQRAS